MIKTKDKIIIQVKDTTKEIKLPLYGIVQLEVKDGKIVGSHTTEKEKYY